VKLGAELSEDATEEDATGASNCGGGGTEACWGSGAAGDSLSGLATGSGAGAATGSLDRGISLLRNH